MEGIYGPNRLLFISGRWKSFQAKKPELVNALFRYKNKSQNVKEEVVNCLIFNHILIRTNQLKENP